MACRGIDRYRELEAVGGEYVIGPTGAISVPMIGEVQASGLTTTELTAGVTERLREKLGQRDLSASLELVEFRPIYVVGDVDKPGEYAFRPDMTVLQAVSIAGGQRMSEFDGLRLGRDAITAEGAYTLALMEMRRLRARRARSQAEVLEADKIDFPPEIANDAEGIGGRLMKEETAIMAARREALQSQLEAVAELKELIEAELQSLRAKIEAQKHQIELAETELDGIRSLVEKGHAVRSRQNDLEREVAAYKGDLLDLETAVLRARQEISKAHRDALDLRNDHASLVLTELQEVEAKLEDLDEEARTASGLYAEATIAAPSLASALGTARDRPPTYSIARMSAVGLQDSVVQEGELVQPGDVIKVTTPSLYIDMVSPAVDQYGTAPIIGGVLGGRLD